MLHERISEPVSRMAPRLVAPAQPQPDDPRVDLKELVRVLKWRRASILWIAAIPVLLALAYSLFATPLYTATTQILIDPRDRRIVSNEVNPESLAADGGIAVVESQLLVITSDTVLRRVIARERLDIDPEFGGEPTGMLSVLLRRVLSAIGFRSDNADRSPELRALRQIKRRIGVKRSEKAFIADVYATTENRDKSVRIADAIAQAYLDDQTEARSAATQRASSELTGRLQALRERVREAEDRVVQYRQQNNIITAGGLLVNEQQLSEMNIQLNNARTRVAEARSRFEQIQRARRLGADSGAIPEAVQSQTVGQLRVHYAEMMRARADLLARLGPRHPDVATLNAQIQSFQGLINTELGRIASSAQSDLERAEASERTLQTNLEELKRSALSTSQASVRLRELDREVETSRNVYQTFLTRARETGEQQSIDSTNARVISSATPPQDKSWPPRGLLLAIALVAGLGIGTGVGLLREYLDEGLHTRKQLQDLTSVPVLGVLPDLSAGGAADEPMSQLATSMRSLLGALFDRDRTQRGRSVLITSATPAEGKTTVALNLALAAAASGRRVLLVDADFDRRTLSKTPVAQASAGLFDLLEGRVKLASVLFNESQTRLSFLPLGEAKRPESYHPLSQAIVQKLTEPARSFDLVILDSGCVTTDAYVRAFAAVADDILFVVREDTTRKDDVAAAFEMLHNDALKIRGTILTGASGDFV